MCLRWLERLCTVTVEMFNILTIPVCMVATESITPVTLEILATGADWCVTSKKLATGQKLGG